MFRHALRSLWNRRFVAALTVLSIASSVTLILGVERLRSQARDSFTNLASGIDLMVAPRGNAMQILMATVFGVGTTGMGLGWETYERVAVLPQLAWSVPIQMGVNHRGFPVMGTSTFYAWPMEQMLGSSITYRIAVGPQQGRKVFTLQTVPACDEPFDVEDEKVAGFSLHAVVVARADERKKLERICHYVSRPAIVEKRFSLTTNGNVRYQLKMPYLVGTTHVIFDTPPPISSPPLWPCAGTGSQPFPFPREC